MKQSFRKFACTLMCASLAALLAACGESPANGAETGNKSSDGESAKSQVTLTLGCSQSQLPGEIGNTLFEEYEKETGVHIDIQVTPDDQWPDVLRTKLSVGEAPDIFWADVDGLSLAERVNPVENCVPLTNEPWAGRLEKTVAHDLTLDGELYGISFKGPKFWLYYYNKDIFNSLNLKAPTNYSEFKEVCQAIKDSGITPIYEAVQEGWHHGLMWYESSGAYLKEDPELYEKINKNEKKVTEVSSMLTVLEQMNEFAQSGFYGDEYVSNSMANDGQAMAEGSVAMTFESNGWDQDFLAKYPEMEGKIGYFALPWGDNDVIALTATQNALFINKNSSNVEEAKKLFEYLARPEKLQEYLDGDKTIYSICWPEIKSRYPEELQAYLDAHEQCGVLQSEVKFVGAQVMEIEKHMASMFMNQETPEECLQKIQDIMDEQGELQQDPYWVK